MIIIICKLKNVLRICLNRVVVLAMHLSIVDIIVCLISWFQFLTAGKSIYKSSKHFIYSHVFLVLVVNVFISIKVFGFIRISSSFSNCCWLIWINLIVVVRSIFNVLESFNLLLTRLPFFSYNLRISRNWWNIDEIIYYQTPQIIPLSRRTILHLTVENPNSTNIGDNFYLIRRLCWSV